MADHEIVDLHTIKTWAARGWDTLAAGRLAEALPGAVLETGGARGETTLVVETAQVPDVTASRPSTWAISGPNAPPSPTRPASFTSKATFDPTGGTPPMAGCSV